MNETIEIKEEVKMFLASHGYNFSEKEVDMIAEEFYERLADTEETERTKLLEESIRYIVKNNEGINYEEPLYDGLEDDYSDESTFGMRR